MCRQETSDKEKIIKEDERLSWESEAEEEEEEDAFSEEDTDIPEFNEAAHALWVMRKTFEMLEDGQSISTDSEGTVEVHGTTENGLEFVRERSQRWCLSLYADESRGYESA
jgi:hypothetical protein